MESLRGCEEAEKKIKTVRDQTKAEKKKLAMAMREKQLKAFGLKANAQGQVQADSSLLQKFVGLAEESGLCCNICRDGYNFQPKKVCYPPNALSPSALNILYQLFRPLPSTLLRYRVRLRRQNQHRGRRWGTAPFPTSTLSM